MSERAWLCVDVVINSVMVNDIKAIISDGRMSNICDFKDICNALFAYIMLRIYENIDTATKP